MPVNALGDEVRHDGALGDSRPNDVALSADGSLVYAAGNDGNLRVYSAESGALLQTIDVGTRLGGIDVSPDGSFVMAVELEPLETHYADPWWDNEFTVTVYRVDLATGEVTSYPFTATGFDFTFFDVAVLANGDVVLSQSILPGWSGWVSMKLLDLDTGTYSEASGTIRHDSILSAAEDGTYVLGAQYDTSDAPLLIYQSGSGVVAEHGLYEDGVSGFNYGVQAFSAAGGFVAQYVYGNGLHIYNDQLQYQLDLTDSHPEWLSGTVSALAFDSSGDFLFVLDNATDSIVQLSTSDWSVVATIPVGADLTTSDGDYGNRLIIGPDMRYFLVVTENGLLQINNDAVSSTINGTGVADDLTGTNLFDEILGGDGNDILSALGGNDIVAGDGGNDLLDGGAGDDRLEGGAGDDALNGGDGSDTAYYAAAAAGVTVNLGIAGSQNTSGAGYDSLSSVENLTGSAHNDTLTGNSGANRINGRSGNDMLNGGAGNDVLEGGAGDDQVNGSSGTDIASYAAATAAVTVSLAVAGAQNTIGAGMDTLSLIEGLEGSRYTDTLTGNDSNNYLYGGASADVLNGGGGNDALDGGSDADIMSGGLGNDQYLVDNGGDSTVEADGEGTDLVMARISHTLQAYLENLTLTGALSINGVGNGLSNILTGNGAANKLYGLDGDDRLFGGAGNDTLDGGVGLDVYYGGAGNDIYLVDNASEVTIENAGEGTDLVNASVSYTLRANVENLTLNGALSLNGKGNELANVLTGNEAANKLFGYGGSDRLVGGDGNDTLDGGTAGDKLFGGAGDDIYFIDSSADEVGESSGQGIDLVRSSVSHSLDANIENLTLEGIANLNGTGNELDNRLTGNSGINVLTGGLGDDKLYGKDGADVLKGDNGSDWLEGGAGRDRFYGGTGADDFVFREGDFAGLTSSTADQIHDFSQIEGDRIRLNLIDANTALAGDQAFAFIGNGAFTGTAGELRYSQISGNTYVMGDTNGDGLADFWIRLDGLHALAGSDFVM